MCPGDEHDDPLKPSGLVGVKVGRMVELTEDERRQIRDLSDSMRRLAHFQRTGWFASFVQHQTRLNRLLRAVVGRSHAS
jgi:hypothetical protein